MDSGLDRFSDSATLRCPSERWFLAGRITLLSRKIVNEDKCIETGENSHSMLRFVNLGLLSYNSCPVTGSRHTSEELETTASIYHSRISLGLSVLTNRVF
jgi:hypothetical protein